jgi:hypothetical protein
MRRHNGVHFFDITTSKTLGNGLRATTACNFSSLIWPHGTAPPQIIGKTQCFAILLPFHAPASSLFCSSLLCLFPPLRFHLSILLEV